MSKKYLFFLPIDKLGVGEKKMILYYQNETLYLELETDLKEIEYRSIKNRLFRIIEDYEVDRVVIEDSKECLNNWKLLRELKQDYYAKYKGDFFIR